MIAKYTKIWQLLGKPETAEQWYALRWDENHPNRPESATLESVRNVERIDVNEILLNLTGINFKYTICRPDHWSPIMPDEFTAAMTKFCELLD